MSVLVTSFYQLQKKNIKETSSSDAASLHVCEGLLCRNLHTMQ